ncbi:MAG: YceD family protein [Alphaproteobacteria bacterium]
MSNNAPPFVHQVDLSRLPEGVTDISLSPNESERARLAAWLAVDSLTGLEATIRIMKLVEGRFSYEANFAADVVQSCVVTLEPVRSRIEQSVHRSYEIMPGIRQEPSRIVQVTPTEDEEPELLDRPVVDVAAPVIEELSLAIEPYPRAPGAVFQQPGDQEARTSPFEVLKSLKTRR